MSFRSLFSIKSRLITIAIILVVSAISVYLLASTPLGDDKSSKTFSAIFILSGTVSVLLSILMLYSLIKLLKEFREKKIGSRIRLKLVFTFFLTTLLPLTVVYYFSTQFLEKAIDSWFDTRIEKSLNNALSVGRNSLNIYKNNLISSLNNDLYLLENSDNLRSIRILDDLREKNEISELTLFNSGYEIIAASNLDFKIIPETIDFELLSSLDGQGIANRFDSLDDELILKVLMSLNNSAIGNRRYLQARYPLPFRFNDLGQNLQNAYDEYSSLKYLRTPLKFSLILTLSLISLISVLSALWCGIFYARRMIEPLTSLAAGTQAVSSGNYSIHLPETTHDELGILIKSFNHMTDKIKQERQIAHFSGQRLKDQRQYLKTILNRLSSGVLSFDLNHVLKTSNAMASTTLQEDLSKFTNIQLQTLINNDDYLKPLWENIQLHIRQDNQEWQSEINLFGQRGRQVLNLRGNKLPYESYLRGGYVIVFEDLTNLIRAQRDAAWGEVARRLAHEIKNPLTPIQLSAERIRNKLMNSVDDEQKEILDRTTRTIVQQVEAMKQMVDVFRDYAQPVHVLKSDTDIHQLIEDTCSLHQLESHIQFELDFNPQQVILMVDKNKLQQVFNNLIINSKEAYQMPDDGASKLEIKITTQVIKSQESSYFEIKFLDNCGGISKEMMDQIFEPYTTSKMKGTGLGLSIVKRTIQEHDGEITAENIALNSNDIGACFKINLPI